MWCSELGGEQKGILTSAFSSHEERYIVKISIFDT